MPQLPFDVRIDRAGHLVVLARRFYEAWWVYIGADTRPANIHAMNRFPEFFRFDEHAHFVSLVMHLACLFERRNGTVNFEALIAEAKSQNLVANDLLAEAASTLSSVTQLRTKLAILRSNLFSHRSDSLSYEDAFSRAAITPFQIRDMTDAGLSIVNTLLIGRGQETTFFSGTTKEHTLGMLRSLGERS